MNWLYADVFNKGLTLVMAVAILFKNGGNLFQLLFYSGMVVFYSSWYFIQGWWYFIPVGILFRDGSNLFQLIFYSGMVVFYSTCYFIQGWWHILFRDVAIESAQSVIHPCEQLHHWATSRRCVNDYTDCHHSDQ